MRAKAMLFLTKLASSVAALSVLCAVSNANSTCLFWTYQPDIPEELQ